MTYTMRSVRFLRENLRHALFALLILSLVAGAACGGKKSEAELASDALSRGLQAHSEGRLDEAAADYREVLVHDPQNKWAFYDLGVIDQTSGRPTAAEADYRLALNVDPNFELALFNLAILRTAAGSTQEAIDLYRRAVAADPSDAGAHLNLGLLLRSVGLTQDAEAEITRAIELDPSLSTRATPGPVETANPRPQPSGSPSP